MKKVYYAVLSLGIRKIPFLKVFLGYSARFVSFSFRSNLIGVVGWGHKPTSCKARNFASKKGLPYIALEDGFLRSLKLGVEGANPHSLIVDHSGIYYDATCPSDLEKAINLNDLNPSQIERALNCISLIKHHRLSKYNSAPEVSFNLSDKPKVLVVDQTFGDASIQYGLANASSFEQMLRKAVLDHPDSEILVKIHPDVLAGKKQGHLLTLAEELGCTLITEQCNPWSVLDIVTDVYVVTSQMGFEALLASKTVHCFGMPFYAGWGLTIDALSCERRKVERSLEAIFYAAYIQYCRYVDLNTGQRCEVEDTIQHLVDERDQFLSSFI
jgi:capsular polysaccharide export protein